MLSWQAVRQCGSMGQAGNHRQMNYSGDPPADGSRSPMGTVLSGAGTLPVRQECLELGTEFIRRRQRRGLGEQPTAGG